MDRRERAFDPFDGTFDQVTMIGFVGGDTDVPVHCHMEVCDVCDGKGVHVNPAIDGDGITQTEMAELGDEFAESYRMGAYDVLCAQCHGTRVVPVPDNRDPNFRAYRDEVQGHHEYMAEVAAERRMGA